MNNSNIKEKGLYIKAVVTDSYKVGGKGKINICYKFYVSDVQYENCKIADNFYNIGDSIEIIYIPNAPQDNNLREIVE